MTTITALPDPPDRTDPTTFSTKGDALMGALPTFVTETNTVAAEVAANAATATTQAGLATTNGAAQVSLAAAQVSLATAQVALATTQANNAANSATASANSALVAGAVAWVSGTTYAIGDARYSPINFQTYRRTTSGAGTTDPSADSTNWTKALNVGISAVTTTTTATTLTSTPTLLKITPASYGVAVTLPDATTCSVGGPLHIIDNKGAYPVRVLNSAGTLLGFIFAGVVSHVSLIDNSTAAGVWTVENNELVGASAQLLTTNISSLSSVTFGGSTINLGSGRELIVGGNPAAYAIYGVVYDSTTNTFGAVTLIRSASVVGTVTCYASALVSTDKVLVASCPSGGGTTFEAVVLTITGTAIAVGTAATATLSAAMSGFADGCGLIAVGSSFVTSYAVATPAAQIRALSISGTTVTIGSATVLDGTAGGLIALGDSTHVIAVSTATTHLYTKPYLVSGSTLTAGTGTDTSGGAYSPSLIKFAALGARWAVLYNESGGGAIKGGVVSLTATGNGTTTISAATLFSTGGITDAIIVGSTKVLAINNQATNNANILTDTAGTASAGTAITTDDNTSRACLYVSGTDVAIMSGNTTRTLITVDCSGASPVVSKNRRVSGAQITPNQAASNAVLLRTPTYIFGAAFAQSLAPTQNTSSGLFTVSVASGEYRLSVSNIAAFGGGPSDYRGKSDSERWVTDGATVITKLECVA